MDVPLSLPLWRKRVLLAAILACLAWWLFLWPHVRGSALGRRAQDLLYLALEDCTAVVPPHPSPAISFIRAHRVGVAPNGSSCVFQAHPPAAFARRASTSRTHKWFVYDSPSEFTELLLDDPNVDVGHTPLSVLEKHALGPEVPPQPPSLWSAAHAPSRLKTRFLRGGRSLVSKWLVTCQVMFHKYLLDDTTGISAPCAAPRCCVMQTPRSDGPTQHVRSPTVTERTLQAALYLTAATETNV